MAGLVAPIRWQTLRIVRIERQTSRVKSVFLSGTQPFDFTAGQHVTVRLTSETGHTAQRSYSIASAPENPDFIELAIERLDTGEVSPYFHDIAKVGDEVEIRGPVGGHFVWSVEDGGPLLLVAGGSGIAPLMSMIRHWAARRSTVRAAVLYSARTWDEILFREELLALAANGLDVTLTLTREVAPPGNALSRRVDVEMVSAALGRLASPPAHVYVCGGTAFVDTASRCIVQCGVSAGAIRTERFGK
ncbi:MAG: ferredoxin reductase [Steroidobacteraceae bacterium]